MTLRAVKFLVVGVLVAGTALHLAVRLGQVDDPGQDSRRVIQPGDRVPDVDLAMVAGAPMFESERVNLPSVVDDQECRILYFFAVDCPACEVGAAAWGSSAARYLERDLDVWWIEVGSNLPSVQSFLDRFGIWHRTFVPFRESDSRRLGIYGTPMVWGTVGTSVRYTISGAALTSPDSLRASLDWCPNLASVEEVAN